VKLLKHFFLNHTDHYKPIIWIITFHICIWYGYSE